MNENIKNYFRDFFSISLSIALHLILFIPISSKIAINDIFHLQDIVLENNASLIEENFGDKNEEIDLILDLNSFKQTKKNVKKITKIITTQRIPKKSNNLSIDQRGIYKGAAKNSNENKNNGNNSDKATTLNIPGWTWDSQPAVNDNSNEVGKIIFEFTIDELGYVIGIKTLEKTVSSSVEKLYRDAVLNLTFKKIDKIRAQEETIGKITFILKYSE